MKAVGAPQHKSRQALPISGTIAWAFAGQGAQTPGMGRDIYKVYPQTRSIFESSAVGFDLGDLCFKDSADILNDTRFTQACMAAFAAAVITVLRDHGFTCDATLGLSLGEYCALYAAGVIDADNLLSLLAYRGAVMADASRLPSRMSAVFGLADEDVEATVDEVASATGNVVACTNYNCPGQVVIGGEENAVSRAEKLLKERGAKRCIPLKTSGPFHTMLMKQPAELLAQRLASTTLNPQAVPVVFNTTAQPASDADTCTLLTKQMTSPVRFAQSIRTLEAAGIKTIIEISPQKVLASLIKKTAPGISVITIETADDLRKLIES